SRRAGARPACGAHRPLNISESVENHLDSNASTRRLQPMATAETTNDPAVVRELHKLGVDVVLLADDPLPDGLWRLIAGMISGIRGKSARWYAAAALYGRFVTVLKEGGTAEGLAEQFGGGGALAPILRHPEMREMVLAANLPGPLNEWLAAVVRRAS